MIADISELVAADYPRQFAIDFDYREGMVEATKWEGLLAWGYRAMEGICSLAIAYCGGYAYVEAAPPERVRPGLAADYQTLHLLPCAPPAGIARSRRRRRVACPWHM